MTSQRLRRRHTLQILGALVGTGIPLAACATMFHVASTGVLPPFTTGIFSVVLLAATAVLACWIWTETAELA